MQPLCLSRLRPTLNRGGCNSSSTLSLIKRDLKPLQSYGPYKAAWSSYLKRLSASKQKARSLAAKTFIQLHLI